jgi:hypothetical protein
VNDADNTLPLYFDDESKEPGLHALIVGVSAYPHLKGGTSRPTREHLLELSQNLEQLTGPAQAAKDLADFLIARKDRLTKPLRTLQLLASPSQAERANGFDGIPSATAGELAKALNAWRDRASRSDQEVTLFHFSGHGSQLSKSNAILLLEDYLGGLSVFDRTIEVNDIWSGMGISRFVKTIGRTQFYFIDCCRVDFEQFRGLKRTNTCSPWDTEDLGSDGRVAAPIFFAAGPGLPTRAVPDEQTTRFGQRLIRCLRGGGAEDIGKARWAVTIGQLSKALGKLSTHENLSKGTQDGDSFQVDNWRGQHTVIHFVDEAPKTSCTFRFQPSDARKGLTLVLDNFSLEPIRFPPELRDPHVAEVVAGYYRISSDPNGLIAGNQPVKMEPPAMEILIEEGGVSCT